MTITLLSKYKRKNPDTGDYFTSDNPRPVKVAEDGKVYPQDGKLFRTYAHPIQKKSNFYEEIWNVPMEKECLMCPNTFQTTQIKRNRCDYHLTPFKMYSFEKWEEWYEKGEKPCFGLDYIKERVNCEGKYPIGKDNDKYFRTSGKRHRAECRKCERELSWEKGIWTDFGLTADQYYQVLDILDGRCMLCRSEKMGVRKNVKHRFVDHQEEPFLLRGILCFKCNTGLGNFNHDIELFEEAIRYLKHASIEKILEKAPEHGYENLLPLAPKPKPKK